MLVSKNNPLQSSVKQYNFEMSQTTDRGGAARFDYDDEKPGKQAEARPNDFNRFYGDLRNISKDTNVLMYSGGARGNPEKFNENRMMEKLRYYKNQIKQASEDIRYGVPPPAGDGPNMILGVKKKFGDELRSLGPKNYILQANQEQWLNKRSKLTESKIQDKLIERNNKAIGKQTEADDEANISGKALQKQQIQIAKDLFLIWDGDGEGSLSPDELMKAFVRIGLS